MPRKNTLQRFKTITAGVMTGTNTLTSTVTKIEYMDNIAYQFSWTNSPVGTFEIQVSLDYDQDQNGNVINAGNWVSVPVSYLSSGSMTIALTIPTSVGSPIFVDLNQLSAPWIRARYTNASSTGVLTAYVAGKEV